MSLPEESCKGLFTNVTTKNRSSLFLFNPLRFVGLWLRLRKPLLIVHLSFSAVSSWLFWELQLTCSWCTFSLKDLQEKTEKRRQKDEIKGFTKSRERRLKKINILAKNFESRIFSVSLFFVYLLTELNGLITFSKKTTLFVILS